MIHGSSSSLFVFILLIGTIWNPANPAEIKHQWNGSGMGVACGMNFAQIYRFTHLGQDLDMGVASMLLWDGFCKVWTSLRTVKQSTLFLEHPHPPSPAGKSSCPVGNLI